MTGEPNRVRDSLKIWLLLRSDVSFWKERSKVLVHRVDVEARQHLVTVGIRLDLGRFKVEFLAPDEASLLALLHDAVEEAAKDGDAIAVTILAQAGMIWQLFM